MARSRADTALVATRLTSQLLAGPPATTADAVVERLLAVQAQDARAFRLNIRSRSSGLRAADVDRALTDGALVVTWLNRGTLHLVRADDYWWLHPLTTPQLHTGNRTRLAQEGVSEAQTDRGVDVIADRADRRRPTDPRATPPPTRRGGRPDRGPGTRPPPRRGQHPGSRRARADGRRAPRVRRRLRVARPGTAADRPRRGAAPPRPSIPRRPRPRVGARPVEVGRDHARRRPTLLRRARGGSRAVR